MTKHSISVTEFDIAGKYMGMTAGTYCPVERAIMRDAGRAGMVCGGAFTLYDGSMIVDLPFEATEWVNRFDLDGVGEPFTFTLELPDA